MAKSAKTDINDLTYEKALSELEEIISRLEEDTSSLEESLVLFERGQKLSQHCIKLLDQAELRVKQLGSSSDSADEGE